MKEMSEGEGKLTEYEERYRSIFMESPIAITLYDSEGKLINTNKACLDLINVSNVEEIKGFDMFNDPNLPKDEKEKLLKGETVRFEGVYNFKEVKKRLKAGKSGIFYFSAIISPIYLKSKGSVSYYLNQVQDITNLKLSENKLKESKEKLKKLNKELELKVKERTKVLKESEKEKALILESISEIIVFQDTTNKIIWANKAAGDSVNLSPEQLVGHKCHEIWHNCSEPCVNCPVITALTINQPTTREMITPDRRIWNVSCYPIHDDKGNTIGIVEVAQNITKRKRAELKLKESKQLLEKTLYSLHDAVFIIDAETVEILECNPSATEIFGYTHKEMIGQTTNFLHVNEEYLEEFRGNLYPAIEKYGFLKNFEFKMKRKDGTIFNTEHSVLPLFDEQKHRFGWVSVVRDITKRKEAEEKLKESEEKYREAYNLVNFYKDLFAHDMNNILQSILSAAEYYSYFRNDPEKLKDFGDISELVKVHIRRGTSLISKVRTLSKLEETEIQLVPIGVFNVLDKSVENAKNSFHEKNINIQIEGLSKDAKILGGELLIDVFDNLLNNAIKFSDDDKESMVEIVISKIRAENIKYIKFEFKDYGMGIPDERKGNLFERQYTEDISKRGMGMGLSLVKKIVDKYGGKIYVEDRIKGNYKEGSNFVVLLKEAP